MLFHGRLRRHCIGNSSIGDCDGHCHDIHVDSDRGQIGSCYHRRCTCYCCTMEWMPAPVIMLQSASWSHVRRVIEEATFHGVTTLHGEGDSGPSTGLPSRSAMPATILLLFSSTARRQRMLQRLRLSEVLEDVSAFLKASRVSLESDICMSWNGCYSH